MTESKDSLSIEDILARDKAATEVPVDPQGMRLELQAALHAYWRTGCERRLGRKVTSKLVAEYAKDDTGYGTLTSAEVRRLLPELRELGWNIDILESEEDRRSSARLRRTNDTPAKTKAEREPKPNVPAPERTRKVPKREHAPTAPDVPVRKRRNGTARGASLWMDLRDPYAPELVGDGEVRGGVVRLSKPLR